MASNAENVSIWWRHHDKIPFRRWFQTLKQIRWNFWFVLIQIVSDWFLSRYFHRICNANENCQQKVPRMLFTLRNEYQSTQGPVVPLFYLHTGTKACRDITKPREAINHTMMTSSNENVFRVIGPLCGELSGHRWIPLTKASGVELWCFLWFAPESAVK